MPRDPLKPFRDYEERREREEVGPEPAPEDDGTCLYCGTRPRRAGSSFCGRDCAEAVRHEDG